MRRPAGAAHRAQKAGIDALDHQRAIDHRQDDQRDGGDGGDHQQRRVVHRQDVAEQHVQQIDIGAVDRNDGDAERERDQIEGGQRGVLVQSWRARPRRRGSPREARDQAADGHRKELRPAAESRSPRPAGSHAPWRRRPGHAPQHQKHADRRAAQRQRDRAASARRMNSNSVKGAIRRSYKRQARPDVEAQAGRRRAQARRLVEGLAHPRAPSADFRRSAHRRWRPRRPARAPAAGFREIRAHQIHVVQRRQHGALFAVPARTRASRSAEVLASMALKGSSSRITARPAAAAGQTACAASARRTACRWRESRSR